MLSGVVTRDLTKTAAFKRWFKNSVVVNDDGSPKVVYHAGSFEEYEGIPLDTTKGVHFGTYEAAQDRIVGAHIDSEVENARVHKDDGRFYLDEAEWPDAPGNGFSTEDDARTWVAGEVNEYYDPAHLPEANFTAAYLSIQNPMRVRDQKNDWSNAIREAKKKGHDGLVYRNEYEDKGSTSYVIFSPTQAKSVNNRGTFDPGDPDVLHGLRGR